MGDKPTKKAIIFKLQKDVRENAVMLISDLRAYMWAEENMVDKDATSEAMFMNWLANTMSIVSGVGNTTNVSVNISSESEMFVADVLGDEDHMELVKSMVSLVDRLPDNFTVEKLDNNSILVEGEVYGE